MKATIVGIAARNNSAKVNVSLNVNILGRHGEAGNYVIDERNYIGVRQRFVNKMLASVVGNSVDGFTLGEATMTVALSLSTKEDKIKFFNQVLRGAVVDIEAIEYSAGEVLSFDEADDAETGTTNETTNTNATDVTDEANEADEVDDADAIVAKYDGVYYKVSAVIITDLAKKIVGVRFANAMAV